MNILNDMNRALNESIKSTSSVKKPNKISNSKLVNKKSKTLKESRNSNRKSRRLVESSEKSLHTVKCDIGEDNFKIVDECLIGYDFVELFNSFWHLNWWKDVNGNRYTDEKVTSIEFETPKYAIMTIYCSDAEAASLEKDFDEEFWYDNVLCDDDVDEEIIDHYRSWGGIEDMTEFENEWQERAAELEREEAEYYDDDDYDEDEDYDESLKSKRSKKLSESNKSIKSKKKLVEGNNQSFSEADIEKALKALDQIQMLADIPSHLLSVQSGMDKIERLCETCYSRLGHILRDMFPDSDLLTRYDL